MEKVLFKSRKPEKVNQGGVNLISILMQFSMLSLSLFLMYNVVRSVQLTTSKLRILHRTEQEVDQLRIENVQLILKKGTFQSDDYIETEARNRLNYSKSGEILFVIPDSTIRVAKVELERILSTEEKSAVQPKSVWEKWYDFFLLGV